MKNIVKTLIIVLFLLVQFTSAADYLFIETEFDQLDIKIEDIRVLKDHIFYEDYFYQGDVLETPHSIIIKDIGGNEISRKDIVSHFVFFPFSENINKIGLLTNNIEVSEREIEFCNNNGICEFCEDSFCTLSENTIVCNDCASGSRDNYCDLANDNRCDPDCNQMDADCEECVGCYYEDIGLDQVRCVEDLNGDICLSDQRCEGGNFVYSDDAGTLCCIGRCVSHLLPVPAVEYQPPVEKEILEEKIVVEEKPKEEDMVFYGVIYASITFVLIVAIGIIFIYIARKQKKQVGQIYNSIASLRLKGYNEVQIRKILRDRGRKESQINKAFRFKK